MVSANTITIKNRTGSMRKYYLFAETPQVSGNASGRLWANVMEQCPAVPNGGVAMFEIYNNYFAICGSFDGKPEHGGQVNVYMTQPVQLGTSDTAQGSTVNFSVMDGGASGSLSSPQTPGKGGIGSFVIDTGAKDGSEPFTTRDAQNNNLFIGVASSRDGNDVKIMSTFTPQPNMVYNIKPQTVFYLVADEELNSGQLVHADMVSNKVPIDFDARGTNRITLVHTERGTFDFQ